MTGSTKPACPKCQSQNTKRRMYQGRPMFHGRILTPGSTTAVGMPAWKCLDCGDRFSTDPRDKELEVGP